MIYFVTGVSGFIGSNLAKRILTDEKDVMVIGLDNMNNYYDVKIKEWRLAKLNKYDNFKFIKGDLADKETVENIFKEYHPNIVVNLAAQAGVRYSITNPDAYIQSNLIGFYNILECCRNYPVEHLVYASSSSVYGSNKKFHTQQMIKLTIQFLCMQQQRNQMNLWLIVILNYIIYHQQG